MSAGGHYTPDPRLTATRTTAGDWILNVSPVAMEDGRELRWWPPQPVAFALLEAKRHQELGVPSRLAIMETLVERPDGAWGPADPEQVLDCVTNLQTAVLFAFSAIESLANHSIDQLGDAATIEVTNAKGDTVLLPKSEMVRRLGLSEKLSRVIPMLSDGANIKGTKPWERYRHLKELRDELVHVKDRGIKSDPTTPSAYDRLMLGHGDDCVGDALMIITAARPEFLPGFVLDALK